MFLQKLWIGVQDVVKKFNWNIFLQVPFCATLPPQPQCVSMFVATHLENRNFISFAFLLERNVMEFCTLAEKCLSKTLLFGCIAMCRIMICRHRKCRRQSVELANCPKKPESAEKKMPNF